VLYTTVDAHCDKSATVVGLAKLSTLATVDVPRRHFFESRVWDKVAEASTVIFEYS